MCKVAVIILLASSCAVALGSGYHGRNDYHTGYSRPYYGHYGYWSEWSDCTVTCGGGTQSRSRECRRPHHGYGQYAGCSGPSTESRECNADPCPVDGGWSEWEPFGECSESCGGGEKSRSRTCTNPEPANGGADCEGDDTDTMVCNEEECPVDGGWSDWEPFGECSEPCGGGEKSRLRTCTNPEPAFGGADCEGDDTETMACNEEECPVDGMWSEWGEFGDCSVKCGRGMKTRSRTCTNPEPAFGGADCEGDDTDTTYCYIYKCPIDGAWTHWSYWSSCSGYCGEGYRVRSRSCSYPAPANGGADCEGDSSETETCKLYRQCYQGHGHRQGYGHTQGYGHGQGHGHRQGHGYGQGYSHGQGYGHSQGYGSGYGYSPSRYNSDRGYNGGRSGY